MRLSKDNLGPIRETLELALTNVREALEQQGVSARVGRCRYEARTASFKIEVTVLGEDGAEQTPEAAAWGRDCGFYGLQAEDLGKTFKSGYPPTEYRITGSNLRARKYPICVERVSDGKRFKFPVGAVVEALKRGAPRSGGSARA